MILDSLNNTSAEYKLSIKSDNEKQIFIFKSDEANFLLINKQDKYIQRIDYDFNRLKDYNFIYVETRTENGKMIWSSEINQNIFTNPILDSLMQELKNTHGVYEKQKELLKSIESQTNDIKSISDNDKTIYLTELQVNDINHDGKIDFYWLAISNGEIIYYEIINFMDTKWINISNTFNKNLFMNNVELKKQIELTK